MKIIFSTLALLALVATSANAKTRRRLETGNPEEFHGLGKHSFDDGRVLNGTGGATNDYSAAVCMVSYFYLPNHLMADHHQKLMTCDAFADHQGITNTPNCDGTNEDGQNIGDHVRYMGVNGCCGDSGGDAKMRARKTACARGDGDLSKRGDTTPTIGGQGGQGGRGQGGCSGHGNCREECKAADDIVSKDVNDSRLSTDGIHISQCIHVDYSSDPWRKDATKWIYKKSTGSCLICFDALKIKFGTKCDNRDGDCKYCDGMIQAYKSCEIISTSKFAVAHTIAFEGISATEFMADSKIIFSLQQTVATILSVAMEKIININANPRDKAKSTRRQLSGRGLAAATACRYEERAAGYF